MRIVKILTPVTRTLSRYETIVPEPQEGGLITVRRKQPGAINTWSYDIRGTKLDNPLRTMYR